MTAGARSALAQRTHEKVRVLQSKLHRAAKEDLSRTFGILYDKVVQWEVLWTAWIQYLNPLPRGWANYFNWLNSGEHFHKIGRYVIQRLNRWNRRKRGRVQRSYRRLTGRELFSMGLYRLSGTVAHVS